MLHLWLIPALIVLAAITLGFYLVIGRQGGTGARTEGKTLVDKPGHEEDLPPV
jgi:hypothetical protein